LAEDLAVSALESAGYQTLERNYNTRVGEIDIIAKKDGYICFVEVKFRNPRGYGSAIDAITKSKMQKILATARYYLLDKGMQEVDYRIDAVIIDGFEVEILTDIYMQGMD